MRIVNRCSTVLLKQNHQMTTLSIGVIQASCMHRCVAYGNQSQKNVLSEMFVFWNKYGFFGHFYRNTFQGFSSIPVTNGQTHEHNQHPLKLRQGNWTTI